MPPGGRGAIPGRPVVGLEARGHLVGAAVCTNGHPGRSLLQLAPYFGVSARGFAERAALAQPPVTPAERTAAAAA